MDISVFDFSPSELTGLLVELAAVAEAIYIEPRLHTENETTRTADGVAKMHEGLTGPTFRITCRPRVGDDAIAKFAAFESALGISSVSDRDGSVRIRHRRVEAGGS